MCLGFDTAEETRGPEECALEYGDDQAFPGIPQLRYCWSEALCARTPELNPEEWEDRTAGLCVNEDYCREAPAAGFDIECVYSDGTPFGAGPPDEPCPTAADERFPFCGRACPGDGCPPISTRLLRPDDNPPACVGISETRGIGVCTFGGNACRPDLAAKNFPECIELFGTQCSCLVRRSKAGLPDRGWTTLEASCLAYRDLYPDDWTCLDADWREIE